MYPDAEAKIYALTIRVDSGHLKWQVSLVAQIAIRSANCPLRWSTSLLDARYRVPSSEEHNEADRIE